MGTRSQTRDAIINVLTRTSKWDNLVDNYMLSLDILSNPVVREIQLNLHPFMPFYRELPSASCGYVYLLCSMTDCLKCFIGETDNMKKSLREHNTGYGAPKTKPTALHPWGVFSFVCGFDCQDNDAGRQRRKDFLFTLELSVDDSKGPEHLYSQMRDQVIDWTQRARTPLVIVKCGELI